MAPKVRNCRLLLRLVLIAACATASFGATAASADTVKVKLDEAQVMQLPEKVATIVIGNPLIADATLQPGGVLIVTGKGYGATNLLALDRNGHILVEKTVEVRGPATADVVTVYKGVDRESYSCSPKCAPRITLGDTPAFFGATIAQTGSRNGQAAAAK
ncbi:MAG TPA: pilus assembly protein N-terminal domain-containing protein [Pseudolabrys sp.]|nr:pilus assembly protein N-terminal domain-containing protein [Pseudolabrys sp.]